MGVPGQKAIWMWPLWSGVEYTIWGKVMASPESMPCQVNPELPVACPSSKGAPECELTNLMVGLMQVRVNE